MPDEVVEHVSRFLLLQSPSTTRKHGNFITGDPSNAQLECQISCPKQRDAIALATVRFSSQKNAKKSITYLIT